MNLKLLMRNSLMSLLLIVILLRFINALYEIYWNVLDSTRSIKQNILNEFPIVKYKLNGYEPSKDFVVLNPIGFATIQLKQFAARCGMYVTHTKIVDNTIFTIFVSNIMEQYTMQKRIESLDKALSTHGSKYLQQYNIIFEAYTQKEFENKYAKFRS